jgi:hypothetical protein
MTIVRQASGKRRSIVKDKLFCLGSLANAFFKNFVLFSKLEDFFLYFRKINFWGNWFKHQTFLVRAAF